MNVFGSLGDGTGFKAPGFFWVFLAVTVAPGILVLIWMGIGKFIAAGKALDQPIHVVSACGINGHVYQVHTAVWRCAACGALAPPEGELP
jgi:hypothetical protein